MQYTVRSIPEVLDRAIRERARAEGKSLNAVAIEALSEGLGVGKGSVHRRNLEDIVGTWQVDPTVEEALAAQDVVDEDLWV